jgi:predicted lipoprotein with Yx(FWY)xxD motif
MKKKTVFLFAMLAVVGAVVVAGCGGGGSSSSTAGSESAGGEESATTTSSSGGSAEASSSGESTIASAEVGEFGAVLVDSEGMTVYEFEPDQGSTSTCYGSCEAEWPPVVAAGEPTAGEGAMSSALGTTKRKDGTMQVTYEGRPLYTFVGDKAPGEANGQGDDGVWWVLDESGTAIKTGGGGSGDDDDSDSTSSSTTPGSGGNGY